MASGQAALSKNAVNLELKDLNTIRWSPESILALEACLLDVYWMLRPRRGDYEQRAVLIRAFNMLAKDAFGNHGGFPVVEAFGSFTMDLFTAGSDLDISINFSDDYTEELPRGQKISILRKLTRFLYKLQRKGNISKILPILRARVPVVKVVDSGTGIECDVSAENKDGVSRSSILTIVSSIDERFRIISYLMKAWAKAHDINSSKDRTMNSLSIISLVAFHLQTRDPPILPPFSALLKDGTDVSSIQKVAVGFKNFGRRNEESIAKLVGTLLIKLSAVESLWPQGLCVSTFEGSWIKKEWETGIANMSIEDFLNRSENFARSVGQFEVKKIYNCIKGSLKLLSRFLEGEIGERELKEALFGSSSLNVPNLQLTGGPMGLKRPISFYEPDPVNPITAKRARYIEAPEELHQNFQTTSPTWPNPFIPLNPRPAFQINHVEDQIKSFEHLQSGYEQQYRRYPPITAPSNPTDTLTPFPPGHVENHLKPFETSQTWHGPSYQPQSPIPPHLGNMPQYHPQRPFSRSSFGFESQWQPPHASNLDHGLDFHLQRAVTPHEGYRPQINAHDPFASQSSYGIEHLSPPFPHQFSFASGHNQPGRNLGL